MYFSWYSSEFCTDPDYTDAEPEARANPSMPSWGNPTYLGQRDLHIGRITSDGAALITFAKAPGEVPVHPPGDRGGKARRIFAEKRGGLEHGPRLPRVKAPGCSGESETKAE